jgi:hypothetical protein
MHLGTELDPDRADGLAIQMTAVINGGTGLTPSEIILACLMVVHNVVRTIDCRDCRQVAIQNIERLVPKMMMDAQATAHQPHSEHHH